MNYIFVYSVIYIKSDFSKLKEKNPGDAFFLIGSEYCLSRLDDKNRDSFEEIHCISRDFHQIDDDEMERIIKQYVERFGAQGIRLLTNEDSAQIGCARLREIYGIPGSTVHQLLPFVHKVISKKRLGRSVRLPDYTVFDKKCYAKNKYDYLNSLEKRIGFPMFIKPVDLVSSIETHRINNLKELSFVAERISAHEYEFEIDEFIDGDLFHRDAMVIDGEIVFFMVGKCSFPLARFFEGKPVGSIPTNNADHFQQLQKLCEIVLKKLKSHDGAYHMEAFLEYKSQEFIFLEIGARTGGALITRVYEKIFGINIEEINYLIQMERIRDVPYRKSKYIAGFLNFPFIKGTIKNIKKPSIDIANEFIKFVRPGDELEQAKNLLDVSCSIIFWDKSYSKVEQAFELLKNFAPLTTVSSHEEEFESDE